MELPKSLPETLGMNDPLAEGTRELFSKIQKDASWATMETVDDKTEAKNEAEGQEILIKKEGDWWKELDPSDGYWREVCYKEYTKDECVRLVKRSHGENVVVKELEE